MNKRTVLKILGALLLITGMPLTAVGLIDLFRLSGWMDGKEELFGLIFLGFPLGVLGGVLLFFGFREKGGQKR